MPTKPGIVVEGGLYHGYNRFARGAVIVGEGDEAERLPELRAEDESLEEWLSARLGI